MPDPEVLTPRTPASLSKAILYLRRAAALRCPTCGESPLFAPWRSVRSFSAWLSPLDGCPRCRYRYEREPGYFLLAIWAFNYGFVAVLALVAYFLLASFGNLSLTALLLCLLVPMPFVSLLVARHAKAFWLAFDHFVDPAKKRRPPTPPTR
jgi:uncharacterized protein (DUF983 family)